VRTYLLRSAEPVKDLTARAINALMRGGIKTMGDLARAAPEDIAKKRNLGVKSLEPALSMRDKFIVENNTL
jgi:DNA-directed RNA polymerase alpha subunit